MRTSPHHSPLADTEDWRLGAPELGETEASIMANFNRFLNLSLGLPSGFIVLAHDLYPVSSAGHNPL